jgi:hypothetical protein
MPIMSADEAEWLPARIVSPRGSNGQKGAHCSKGGTTDD